MVELKSQVSERKKLKNTYKKFLKLFLFNYSETKQHSFKFFFPLLDKQNALLIIYLES